MKGKSMAAILLVTALGLTACGGQGTGAAASQEAAQEAQTGEAGGEQSEEADEKSGIRNTARHLLELNLLSLENISRATGLSIDELKKLQQ